MGPQSASQGEVTLERVTLLVLDEADRMLECGFEEQVGRIGKILGAGDGTHWTMGWDGFANDNMI